ncbi:unnamed protein product [Prorocentrum cordatum]|uniref:Uncharacterized protein n=1 Tax=Prorocentrum cordatum TaxID=2364126 RepID=A0ABN9QLW7_9DINO|nr:unnamed protein product [Polarella glacialis]
MQHAAAPRWAPPRRGGCLAVVGVLLAALPWPGRPLALVVGRPLPTVAPRGLSRSVARAAQGRAPMRCPGWPNCGCDGQGHLVGPLGKFMENSPIKAYRRCPKWVGPYVKKGIESDDLFKISDAAKDSFLLEVPATWRSLTKIRLREYADVRATATGEMLRPFEKFEVEDVIRRDGQHFLKLSGRTGWAFDRGIAGAWLGRPICERLDTPL